MSNFRNFDQLKLVLKPGLILVHGKNGQGKSNLLEALFTLVIAKSPRANSDRELVPWHSNGETYSQIKATAQGDSGSTRVQIDFHSGITAADESLLKQHTDIPRNELRRPAHSLFEKHAKINGVPRKTSELVGKISAVMFSAQDLDIVLGSPTMRRRYLDILIAQLDSRYLKSMQKYQKILLQRNHLLKSVRAGHSKPTELEFWNEEFVKESKYIMIRRHETVKELSKLSKPIHRKLANSSESLTLVYQPSTGETSAQTEDELTKALLLSLTLQKDREIANGFTSIGPHRDDIQILLDGMAVGSYASRGQCRTTVLAMKLAEASHIVTQRRQQPVLLLDDVLSELDAVRRYQVLQTASQYEQCFVTTSDLNLIDEKFMSKMSRFLVKQNRVEPEPTNVQPGRYHTP